MADTLTLGHRLLTYFAGPTLDSASTSANEALDLLHHSTHAASEAATQIRDLISNPGGGLSGQPTIPRDQFTQKLAAFYYDVFNAPGGPRNHVLVVYDRAPRLVSFRNVLGSNGRYLSGPTEVWTCHKKVHRGKGRIGLWGFHVWVFGEGVFELLGDGGFGNWCFRSDSFERMDKRVVFHRLV